MPYHRGVAVTVAGSVVRGPLLRDRTANARAGLVAVPTIQAVPMLAAVRLAVPCVWAWWVRSVQRPIPQRLRVAGGGRLRVLPMWVGWVSLVFDRARLGFRPGPELHVSNRYRPCPARPTPNPTVPQRAPIPQRRGGAGPRDCPAVGGLGRSSDIRNRDQEGVSQSCILLPGDPLAPPPDTAEHRIRQAGRESTPRAGQINEGAPSPRDRP